MGRSNSSDDTTLHLGSETPAAASGNALRPVLKVMTGHSAGRIFSLPMGALTLGRSSENDMVLDDHGVSRTHCKLILQEGRTRPLLVDLNSRNGTWVNGSRIASLELEDGFVITLGSTVRLRLLYLAPEESENEQKLYEGATRDPLTGVFNRRSWLEQTRQGLARNSGAVALCDLDHFKQVNDTHGHAAGDAVLTEFCRRLRGLGQAVLAGRYGGEEFAFWLPGFSPQRASQRMSGLLQSAGDTPFELPGGARLGVTLSIGLASTERTGEAQLDELLRAADLALSDAKRAGRNRLVVAGAVAAASPSTLPERRPGAGRETLADLVLAADPSEIASASPAEVDPPPAAFDAAPVDVGSSPAEPVATPSPGGASPSARSSTPPRQKRQHARAACRVTVQIDCAGSQFNAELSDVGVGGARLVCTRFLPLHTPLALSVPQLESPPLQAEVRWCEPGESACHVGIRFLDSVDHLRGSWLNELLRRLGRPGQERRHQPRYTVRCPVQLQGSSASWVMSLADLSPAGLKLEGSALPPRGEAVHVQFAGLTAPARVLWSLAPFCGLRFLPLSPAQKQTLEQLVNHAAARRDP